MTYYDLEKYVDSRVRLFLKSRWPKDTCKSLNDRYKYLKAANQELLGLDDEVAVALGWTNYKHCISEYCKFLIGKRNTFSFRVKTPEEKPPASYKTNRSQSLCGTVRRKKTLRHEIEDRIVSYFNAFWNYLLLASNTGWEVNKLIVHIERWFPETEGNRISGIENPQAEAYHRWYAILKELD